jgi:hypothetical protein
MNLKHAIVEKKKKSRADRRRLSSEHVRIEGAVGILLNKRVHTVEQLLLTPPKEEQQTKEAEQIARLAYASSSSSRVFPFINNSIAC